MFVGFGLAVTFFNQANRIECISGGNLLGFGIVEKCVSRQNEVSQTIITANRDVLESRNPLAAKPILAIK